MFTIFLGAIMRCKATEVPNDDKIPQLLDTESNLSGEAICEVQNTRGTEEVLIDLLPFHSTFLSMNEFAPLP